MDKHSIIVNSVIILLLVKSKGGTSYEKEI